MIFTIAGIQYISQVKMKVDSLTRLDGEDKNKNIIRVVINVLVNQDIFSVKKIQQDQNNLEDNILIKDFGRENFSGITQKLWSYWLQKIMEII